MSTNPPLVIASQLGNSFNQALRTEFPQAAVHAVGRGVPQDLPADTKVLVALPMWAQVQSPVPAGWPHALQWVQLAAVGVDGYPDWLLRGTPVSAARGTASLLVAEYALAAIFAAAKDFPGLWIRDAAQWQLRPTGSVSGATLGLYGWGSIAQLLAQRALALGMRVLALRRSDAPLGLPGVQRAADLQELLRASDHLVLAAPATPDTRKVIDRAALLQARPGLHLVNVARGSLVDQAALLESLDAGRLSRATLDVTDPEPLPAGHALYQHPKVFLSPHTSAISPDSEQALLRLLLRNLARWQRGEALEHALDLARGY
ncbi:NAD(P)-dependent oxidoreductase [Xylophilus sp. GW821-FHT01B05]